MGADQNIQWHAAVASALAWWHEAGVDTLVEDAPRDWLSAPAPQPAAAPVAAEAMPGELAAFLEWRDGELAPEAGWSGASVTASGPVDAAVMVLVDCPERLEGDGGLLSSQASGLLFERMLAAIGLARDRVHLAAVCCRRPPPGRIPAKIEERLGTIARHHVGLIAPERLLLLGNAASRAVLGMDTGRARGHLHPVNHEGGTTGVVASWHPSILRDRPAAKAEAWKDLQLLVGGMTR